MAQQLSFSHDCDMLRQAAPLCSAAHSLEAHRRSSRVALIRLVNLFESRSMFGEGRSKQLSLKLNISTSNHVSNPYTNGKVDLGVAYAVSLMDSQVCDYWMLWLWQGGDVAAAERCSASRAPSTRRCRRACPVCSPRRWPMRPPQTGPRTRLQAPLQTISKKVLFAAVNW